MIHSVIIKPNSRKGPLIELQDDKSLVVYVREPAIEGIANIALVKLLAEYFTVPKTRVTIIRGLTAKHKLVEIKT